jgi:hypothetical protein
MVCHFRKLSGNAYVFFKLIKANFLYVLNSALKRIPSSGMLRRMALVRTDVSMEPSASIIKVTRIGEVGTTLDVTRNRRTLPHYFFAVCVGC